LDYEQRTLPGKESTTATSRNALSGAYARLALVGALALIGALVVASAAQAAVSISRAELSGTQLRIEGQASANRTITWGLAAHVFTLTS
jgi:hypothetical protein